MPDDDTPTRPETPSAMLRLGLVSCPACDRRGRSTTGEECFFCQGGRVVTLEKKEEWDKAHGKKGTP